MMDLMERLMDRKNEQEVIGLAEGNEDREFIYVMLYNQAKALFEKFDDEVVEQVEIYIKYEGYIAKEEKEVEKMLEYEKIKIPDNLDYNNVTNMAKEAIQKLNEIKPVNVAQALRVSGVNPSDITMLLLYLKRLK